MLKMLHVFKSYSIYLMNTFVNPPIHLLPLIPVQIVRPAA